MPWNSVWPLGTTSVKNNKATGQQNTTYIEDTMNKDHFWFVGADEDGRHNVINMPKQSSDPAIATGMSGNFYLREVSASNGRVQGYYQNTQGIYQFVPCFQSGTVVIPDTSTYVTVTSVPDNSYGNIYLFTNDSSRPMQQGCFKAAGGVVQAYGFDYNGTSGSFIQFGNNTFVDGLNIKARGNIAISVASYQYRIIYWGI